MPLSKFSTKKNQRYFKVALIIYFLLMTLELAFSIAKNVGFNYENSSLTISQMINYFTTFSFTIATIIFIVSFLIARYSMSIALEVLSICIVTFLKKRFDGNRAIINILITIKAIHPNGSKGEYYEIAKSSAEALTEKKVRIYKFLLANVWVTLSVYYLEVLHSNLITQGFNTLVWLLMRIFFFYFLFSVSIIDAIVNIKPRIQRYINEISPRVQF